MTRIGTAIDVGRSMVAKASDEQVTFLAAAVAYYAFVSLIPLLVLAIVAGTALGGVELVDSVLGALDQFLTRSGQTTLRDALTSARGRTSATAVSLVLLTWSALKLFRGLDVAFSQIYGVEERESLVQQVVDGLVVLLTLPLAIGAAVGVTVAVPHVDVLPYVDLTSALTLPIARTLVFLPAFYVFPDVEMSIREAAPGAAFAAVGWTLLAQGFRAYATAVGGEVYGILGAALLLVTWLYFGGIVITLGAVANAVLSGRTDDEDEESRPEPPAEAPDVAELGAEVEALRDELDAKTVSKAELKADLKQYVRQRLRRGKARGWGPYLVLLYGTAMTVGAFAYLSGGWAILAMVVVWLSTLGLYTLMVLFGLGVGAIGLPGRIADRVSSWRR